MTNRIFVKESRPSGKCTGIAAQSTSFFGACKQSLRNSRFVGLYERMADNELENQRSFDTN